MNNHETCNKYNLQQVANLCIALTTPGTLAFFFFQLEKPGLAIAVGDHITAGRKGRPIQKKRNKATQFSWAHKTGVSGLKLGIGPFPYWCIHTCGCFFGSEFLFSSLVPHKPPTGYNPGRQNFVGGSGETHLFVAEVAHAAAECDGRACSRHRLGRASSALVELRFLTCKVKVSFVFNETYCKGTMQHTLHFVPATL